VFSGTFLFLIKTKWGEKMHLNFETIMVETTYSSSIGYISLNCRVLARDEQTGHERVGGLLQAIVMSENWSNEHLPKLANGIDERLSSSLMCLHFNRLFMGTVAIIMQSEFSGDFREMEDKAFIELSQFLVEVLCADNIITFPPFVWETKKKLGYKKITGEDKRRYFVKSRDQEVLSWIESDEENDGQLRDTVTPYYRSEPLVYLYRLKSVELAKGMFLSLSEDAKQLITVFEEQKNKLMVTTEIRGMVNLSSDDVSLAILELIEFDLVEETTSAEITDEVEIVGEPAMVTPSNPCNENDLLKAIEDGDIGKVKEILKNGGIDVNAAGEDEKTGLFVAIEKSNEEMVGCLLEFGADPNYETSDGTTALKLCWRKPNRFIEKLLADHGAVVGF
jgi:hypothetical protein